MYKLTAKGRTYTLTDTRTGAVLRFHGRLNAVSAATLESLVSLVSVTLIKGNCHAAE